MATRLTVGKSISFDSDTHPGMIKPLRSAEGFGILN